MINALSFLACCFVVNDLVHVQGWKQSPQLFLATLVVHFGLVYSLTQS